MLRVGRRFEIPRVLAHRYKLLLMYRLGVKHVSILHQSLLELLLDDHLLLLLLLKVNVLLLRSRVIAEGKNRLLTW